MRVLNQIEEVSFKKFELILRLLSSLEKKGLLKWLDGLKYLEKVSGSSFLFKLSICDWVKIGAVVIKSIKQLYAAIFFIVKFFAIKNIFVIKVQILVINFSRYRILV